MPHGPNRTSSSESDPKERELFLAQDLNSHPSTLVFRGERRSYGTHRRPISKTSDSTSSILLLVALIRYEFGRLGLLAATRGSAPRAKNASSFKPRVAANPKPT